MSNIIVFGSSGAIGTALIQSISKRYIPHHIYAVSNCQKTGHEKNITYCNILYDSEESISLLASKMKNIELDVIIVATGVLHNDKYSPEKSIQDLSASQFHFLFSANTVFPALVAKHFSPLLNRSKRSVFAALSARIGSISDNKLGGWYSYRVSKAGLNMIIKNLAIEFQRINKKSIFVGLHPGTVDSPLSQPFRKTISSEKIFTPRFSSNQLINILQRLTPIDTGKIFSWEGKEITP